MRDKQENEKMLTQAKAIQTALTASFGQQLLVPGTTATTPQVPPQAPPQQPQTHPQGDHAVLTPVQCRLLEAEFGHTFKITDGSKEAVCNVFHNLLRAQKHAKTADTLIKRISNQPPPKPLKERGAMVWDLIQKM